MFVPFDLCFLTKLNKLTLHTGFSSSLVLPNSSNHTKIQCIDIHTLASFGSDRMALSAGGLVMEEYGNM